MTVSYSDKEQLRLHVYTVGYPSQGESILIIVAEKGKPLLTLVTDCYEDNDYNHVSTILTSEWNSPQLDLFIWTHPHKDHSLGIEKFCESHDSEHKSLILMPVNFVNATNMPGVKIDATAAYEYISKNYIKSDPSRYRAALYNMETEMCYRIKVANSSDSNEFDYLSMHILGPVDCLTAQVTDDNDMDNKFSIVFSLCFGGINLFMGGDMDKDSVRFIDDDCFSNVNFVKIPHHGSKDDNKDLIHRFGVNTASFKDAVTTVHNQSNPNEMIMDEYSRIMDTVGCTGPKRGTQGTNSYGCIHMEYDLANAVLMKREIFGNAYFHKA